MWFLAGEQYVVMANSKIAPRRSHLCGTGGLNLEFGTNIFVISQIRFPRKASMTHGAGIRFLIGVHSLVYGKIGFPRETFLTDTADVGLLTGVYFFVLRQPAFLGKTPVTDPAGAGLPASVHPFVPLQARLVAVPFRAKLAGIGPFACVQAQVRGKVSLHQKHLVADIADVLLQGGVLLFMNHEVAFCDQACFTYAARVRLHAAVHY